MAREKKQLIKNDLLNELIVKYSLGVPVAHLHRLYIMQGPEYAISLVVFTRLLRCELGANDNEQ